MGAWGSGTFENDGALDLVGELEDDAFDLAELQAEAAEAVLDSSTGERILALIDLVNASLGSTHLEDTVDVDLASVEPYTTRPVIDWLLHVAARLADPERSELAEVWLDADEAEFLDWRTQVQQSIEILRESAERIERDGHGGEDDADDD